MHLVMQYLELGGPDPEEQVRQLTERRLLTPQQAEAVDMERIRAFLATPLAQEIRQARQVWREYRFALLMPAALYDPAAEGEELMLQGVVDCAFRTEEGLWWWTSRPTVWLPARSRSGRRSTGPSWRPMLRRWSR